MKCPKCGTLEDRVIDSRSLKAGAVIRRRRECLQCMHRFTTYEEIERNDLWVIKRDGRYELFEKKKLMNGMTKACEKRSISHLFIEREVDKIIEQLEAEYGSEVPSTAVGEKIMTALQQMDEVAYVRFASVYRQFKDIHEFVNTVQNLKIEEPTSPSC